MCASNGGQKAVVKYESALVAIPLDYVTDDVFVSLYRDGWTESAPDFASQIVFGIERPELVERVKEYRPYAT